MFSSTGATQILQKGNFRINTQVCVASIEGEEVASSEKKPSNKQIFHF